jgi:excinuclease ABC subunit C
MEMLGKPMENIHISKDKLNQIPKYPGIYKMLDSRGNIIYIGKSKCLQKRVKSYFVTTPKWEKVNRMVTMIKDIDYIVTDTHLEARLLECNLIKEFKPRFNAQMKNDQRYFYIKVENYNRYNPLSIVDERTEHCFGPFRSKYTISEFLDRLKNLYPIMENNGQYELEYHMFPVIMEEGTYNKNKDMLLELFTREDNIQRLIETLQSKLEEAAMAYRYELASVYRDMMHCFRMIKNGLDGYKNLASREILLTIPIEKGYKLFFVIGGNVINSLISTNLTKEIKERFIEDSMLKRSVSDDNSGNEKVQIDYRDILYSEISDMSEEMVELL